MTKPIGTTPGPGEIPRNILDNLLEGLQVVSPDYRYLYVNRAAARHGRHGSEALVGLKMSEAYPGIEDTGMFLTLRRCMDERTDARMENAFEFPDGSQGWFELRFEPVPEGVAILSVDITDRKRAELAVRRSIRALATLSRSGQVLIHADDQDSLVRDVARIFVDVGGYPVARVGLVESAARTGITWVASATADGVPSEAQLRELADTEGVTGLVEGALTTRESVVAHWSPTGSAADAWGAVTAEHGFRSCLALPVGRGDRPIGVLVVHAREPDAFDDDEREVLGDVALDLGYGIDVLRIRKARAEAAAQLEEARARTRAIYDHLPHATLLWRRAAAGFTLVDANEAAGSLTAGAVSRQLGRPASVFGSALPRLEEDLASCVLGHEPIRREADCSFPGMAEALRMVLTYGHVPPDLVLLHAEDVTEQRRTEEQLAAVERLEAVGRLAGGVAHDFNNLLTVILTSTAFALERLDESDPVREEIAQVQEAGRSAATLTSQLLAFSRRQVLEPRVTDLNSVVLAMEPMIRRVLREDIAMEVHLAPDLGKVMADAAQLERVIMNLALNARDAMPGRGKLTIETSNADLDEEYADHHIAVRAGPHVCVSVTDTGAGMDPETRGRIFEPFFTTKTEGSGTGLGLSSVYGIVKQSDGNIWVYSEPGEGTTFKIYLPRVESGPVDQGRGETTRATTGDESILVVEDEDGVRRAAERVLVGAGYRVLTASDGASALSLCEEPGAQVDLLLSDVVMPGMRGEELAERLRRRWPTLKVLFMSGYADRAVGDRGALPEGAYFLGKPFSVETLRRKVRDVLDGG